MSKNVNIILATDCGSTTTKAILIELIDGEYRLTCRGEAPTTVEAPFEDVTRGVLNSIIEIEELSNRKILNGEKIINTCKEHNDGVDVVPSKVIDEVIKKALEKVSSENTVRDELKKGDSLTAVFEKHKIL